MKREKNGRFIVSIPFKEGLDKLGDSKQNAYKRFLSLERKLKNNESFKIKYIQFMNEYQSLDHMTKTTGNNSEVISYYMPHHGVIKEDRLTTKLRVVFDGSAATTSGTSINTLQMVGPKIQQELLSIILRFRKHAYVLSADIEKMYRQVLIAPEQRSLQRILWRANPNDELGTYDLNTVTYGTASSSFLAIRCLYQLGLDCETDLPYISNIIKKDFYVDDLLTGSDTIDKTKLIANQIDKVLLKGCFKLRKWVSNEPEITKHVAKLDDTSNIINLGTNENRKTLGLIWNYNLDKLMYKISVNSNKNITKRSILSDISQIFDPLGLLGPCTVTAKIMLQKLWLDKLSWDESLPTMLHTKWLHYRTNLTCLNNVSIKRQVICNNPISVQLHGFSDASENAYGACVYLRSQDNYGHVYVHLLCSKNKVAPLRCISVPRLELCGALILAKLVNYVKTALDTSYEKCIYWCDSTIVLGWLKSSPNTLKTFVANRISTIQSLTDFKDWRHVPTTDNPADHLSRGIEPQKIINLRIWWNGPVWLQEKESEWPKFTYTINELPEKRNIQSCAITLSKKNSFLEVFSNLSKLERVTAYCLRFKNNCSNLTKERKYGPLHSSELRNSSQCLIKISQHDSFSSEIICLINNLPIASKSRLINLNPFLDENGIIRVGGRLQNSNFKFDKKYPILLSSKHHFTKLLFTREHKNLLHAGPQMLLASLRERFWPIQGRNLARKTVHNCIICFKANPTITNPIMGDLPRSRVIPNSPFTVVGVDYAGPFSIKDRKGRGCKISKCYLCLFVCFSTRAIHLELVTDLTKDSFIKSLRRFVSRRGKPAHIYSDNGTTFVGANSELKTLGKFLIDNSNNITETIENIGISWHFIPAHSPHFGGLWEAGVKSTKYHLKRIASNAILTFEELYTLLVQIEAVLNSRPISPLSCDPNDLSPLTPAHFLIGKTLTSVADPNLLEIAETKLSHFQRIQQMKQHFWARWSKEYISEMQQRIKWKQTNGKLSQGMMVLLKEENQQPMQWKLGRVILLHPGKDGVSRVATIKTATGTVRRSFTKICPLPLEHDNNETV